MNDNSRTPAPNSPTGRALHDLARRDVPDDRDLRADVLHAIEQRRATTQVEPRAWSGPAIDPAARRRQAQPTTTSSDTEEYTDMRTAADTTRDGPVSLRQRRWAREALKIAAAAVIFITIGAVLALVLRDDDDTPAVVAPGPTPTPVVEPSPTATAAPAASPTVVAQVASPTAAQDTTPTEVPAPSPIATEVVPTPTPVVMGAPAADLPVAGQTSATIPVGAAPCAVAAGHGSIWVYNYMDGTLSRIDPATNAVVATIPVATPVEDIPSDAVSQRLAYSDLAIDATSVWVIKPADGGFGAAEGQAIAQVDPTTNSVVATIPLPARAFSIASDGTSLWATLIDASSVVRIDTATREVVATIAVPSPGSIAAYEDTVWVINFWDDQVMRIDPTTNQVVAQIKIHWPGAPITGALCALCAHPALTSQHAVWAKLRFGEAVARLDPVTNRLTAVIPVGPFPISLASDGRGIWVGHNSSTGVLLIDPATNEVVASVPATEPPNVHAWITLWENTIWVTHAPTNDVARIDLQAE